MDFIKITRGKQYWEINSDHVKGSLTKAKKMLSNIPKDVVEKAHEIVNGKPKKKKSSDD